MHAKLPAMMIARKIHRITIRAKPLTSYPVRSASSSLIVGRSVNVKIVASTADQLDGHFDQPPGPTDHHDEKLHEPGPIEPHHAERVPPRQRDRLHQDHRPS